MDYDNIKELLEKYYNGISTTAEENILQDYFSSNFIDPKLKEFQIDFQFSEAGKRIKASEEFKQKLAKRVIHRKKEIIEIPSKWVRYAAAVIIVALTFVGGFITGNSVSKEKTSVEELSELKEEINNLKSMYALSLFDQQLAQKRMEAISIANSFDVLEDNLLSEIVNALRYDENENVRLMALEVLKGFIGDEKVYRAILSSILYQRSELVVQDMLNTTELIESQDAKQIWMKFFKNQDININGIEKSFDSISKKIW